MKKLIGIALLTASTILAGCGDSQESFVSTGSVGGPASPIARADSYETTLGTSIAVPADTGVLTNDTLNAAPDSVTVAFPAVTSQGGQVTLGDNSGAFTYTPAQGFVGTDGFSYDLSNGQGTSRATVTISVALGNLGPGFYVDSVTGNDSTGDFDSGSPFATVQAAVAAAGPDGDVVVFPGRGTYTGAVNLLNGQRLLGFASGQINAQGADRPTLSGPVILADGNTVDSIRVVRTDGIAIDGDGQVNGTVTNCEVANTQNGGTGIQIRDISGNWLVEGNTVTETTGIGIDLDTQNQNVAVVRVNDNEISGSKLFGLGIAAFGQSDLKIQVTNNTLSNNLRAFSVLSGTTGTSSLCMQILSNENDSAYRFVRQSALAPLRVEQFLQLETLNTGTVEDTGSEPVTPVPANFCGF
jgi:hypothetical protein